jgi:predicted ATPase/DNA-binding SARP family transcriptional activator/Tfp pilus assembly protein PilF
VAAVKVVLLGSPQIVRDGKLAKVDTRKAIAIIAYLALSRRTHSRGALAALLWPEHDQQRAHANLRRTLWSVNRALGKEWLNTDRENITLRRGPGFWVDVDAFRGHLAESAAHAHADSDVCTACITSLSTAVGLYGGDFLAGFTLRDSPGFDDWQLFQAESLRGEMAGALQRLVRYDAVSGRLEEAIHCARRWVALDPLHEPAHRELMKLYTWAGQRSTALRQYQDCARILEAELGASPEDETIQLWEAIQAERLPPPPEPTLPVAEPQTDVALAGRPEHNLPAQATPFVGRKGELAEIARLTADRDCRLLTLSGAGGIGKTRLAVQAACEQLGRYRHGAWFVPLAAVSAIEFIVPSIADALGFSFFQGQVEEPKQQLLNHLRHKHMLLVLDNFEHLIDGAQLLAEILAAAPQIKILASSRQRLNLAEEWVLEIDGMEYPKEAAVESVQDCSATQLFLQQARHADARFTLTEGDARHVVRICQLVEGMPLAIELAAAWVRVLSCEEIAREIEHSLNFLSTSTRGSPARHRSIRAVFDHSWQLLSQTEMEVFERLSVCRGGFDREAALEVAGADLPVLVSLVDKSLLHRDASGRYQVHDLLRQYAAERLDQVPEECGQTRDRHCSYFATYLQQREAQLRGAGQKRAVDEIGAQIENVRAAWHWATEQHKVAEMARAAWSLSRFYRLRNLHDQGYEAFGRAVAALTLESRAACGHKPRIVATLGMLLAFQGYCAAFLYLGGETEALFHQSLRVLRPLGWGKELALATALAVDSGVLEDPAEAILAVRESLDVFTQLQDQWGVATCFLLLGAQAALVGEIGEAKQHLRESLDISTTMSDLSGMASALSELGAIAQHQEGDRRAAKGFYEQALALHQQLGDRWGEQLMQDFAGYVARELGEYEEAERLHQQSLAISEEIGDPLGMAGSLDNLGLVALDTKDLEAAERLFREALVTRTEVGHQWSIAVSREHMGDVALARGDYGEAERQYQRSIGIHRGLTTWGLVTAHRGLAEVSLALGDVTRAEEQFYTALEAAVGASHVPVILDVLVGMANLGTRRGRHEKAAELSAYVAQHSASSLQTRNAAKALLNALGSQLSPDAMASVLSKGMEGAPREVAERELQGRRSPGQGK